ncbi:MAG: hypothetical protein GQ580_01750 [Candidatus Thorarchaeota archaeon]|nr:hypothetical protein [Candidatus Thorarchaeota archaeon]
MKDIEFREMGLRVMEATPAAYFTNVDEEGFPQTRAMFNLRNKEKWPKLAPLFVDHDDDFMIIFSTNTTSTKVEQMKENPKVSVYYCQPEEWKGMMLSGVIEIVSDLSLKKSLWHDGWEKYYPKGYDDPDHTVLRLFPTAAKGWNQSRTFQFMIEATK